MWVCVTNGTHVCACVVCYKKHMQVSPEVKGLLSNSLRTYLRLCTCSVLHFYKSTFSPRHKTTDADLPFTPHELANKALTTVLLHRLPSVNWSAGVCVGVCVSVWSHGMARKSTSTFSSTLAKINVHCCNLIWHTMWKSLKVISQNLPDITL